MYPVKEMPRKLGISNFEGELLPIPLLSQNADQADFPLIALISPVAKIPLLYICLPDPFQHVILRRGVVPGWLASVSTSAERYAVGNGRDRSLFPE